MCTESADNRMLSVSDSLLLLPSLFFSSNKLEEVVPLKKFSHSELLAFHTNVLFLEELYDVPYVKLWQEAENKCTKDNTQEISCFEFETQNVTGKVTIIIQLIQHMMQYSRAVNLRIGSPELATSSSKNCAQIGCSEVLDAGIFESEIVSIVAAVVCGLPNFRFLPDFIFGYVTHAVSPNYTLLERIIRNFPHEWFSVWRFLSKPRTIQNVGFQVDPLNWSSTDYATKNKLWSDCDSLAFSSRVECAIRILLLVKPIHAQFVMEYCISNHMFPGLTMDLIFWLNERRQMSVFLFLKRVLLDSGSETRSWICDYLNQKTDHLAKLDRHLIETTSSLIPQDPSTPISDEGILKALTLLRVLTALRGFVNYTFSFKLSSRLLKLLTHQTAVSERGSHYITYALAFLIGLRSSLSSPPDATNRVDCSVDTERTIVGWLQRLIDQQDCFQSLAQSTSTDVLDSASPSKPYVEPLLLLAILFHTNQPGPITELISNLLGLRIPSLGRTVNGWRKTFLNSVFTESMIANQAARIPITRGLNRRLASHLPIQCILQLLKSHAFAKNKLHIKEWVSGQLCESVRPLHPLLPDLVEAHIVHSFGSTPTSLPPPEAALISPAVQIALLSEQELMNQFGGNELLAVARMCAPSKELRYTGPTPYLSPTVSSPQVVDLTPALLFLYYALFVYDYQLTLRISTNRRCLPGEASCVYSEKLWDCIPITYLLQHARAHLSDYRPLYPRLLQLVTNHMPHLTVGELIIQDELLLDPIWCAESELTDAETSMADRDRSPFVTVCNPEELDTAFADVHTCLERLPKGNSWLVLNSDTHRAVRHLVSSVNSLALAARIQHVDILVPYGAILGHRIPRLLQCAANTVFATNRRFVRLLEYLWRRLHMVMPRRLDLLTIAALEHNSSRSAQEAFPGNFFRRRKPLCGEDLYIDPVENVMNNVDPVVFRCPSLLRIFLRILESNVLASRSHWMHRLVERVVPPPTTSTANCPGSSQLPNFPSTAANIRTNSAAPTNGADTPSDNVNTTQTYPSASTGANVVSDDECERLCSTMLLTQNATIVHLLLEHCLPTEDECALKSEVCVLREIRNTICTYIHYMFIAEPALADVIVWQTFPRSLLAVSAQAIPSLHICLDSVVNVFRLSGDYAKMVFCLDLVSHLSLHYNIQSALERAAFMIDSFHHILTVVVCADERPDLLQACLPAFVRLAGAFPSLAPAIARLLLSVGALIGSTLAEATRTALRISISANADPESIEWTEETLALPLRERSVLCLQQTMLTFDKVVRKCAAQRYLYYQPEWSTN